MPTDDILLQARALLKQAHALEKEVDEFFEREAQQEGLHSGGQALEGTGAPNAQQDGEAETVKG